MDNHRHTGPPNPGPPNPGSKAGVDTSVNLDTTIGPSVSSISVQRELAWALRNRYVRTCLLTLAIVIVVSAIAWFIDTALFRSTRRNTEEMIQAILSRQIEAVDLWLEAEFRTLETWSRADELVSEIMRIDAVARAELSDPQRISQAGDPLRSIMQAMAGNAKGFRYAVWNREFREIAAAEVNSPVLGNAATDFGDRILSRVMKGENVLWLQSTKGYITRGYQPPAQRSKPDIALIVPVWKPGDEVPIAALLISGFGLQDRFERLTATARFGKSGETYAIDEDGYLITESRFASHLQSIGLIPEGEPPISARVMRVADPGVNTYHTQPDLNRQSNQWPLTVAARAVINREDGRDFDGYPDYRGVPVVGTWAWLDKYDFGMITEVDYSAAYAAMAPLRQTYGSLLLLCGLVGVVSFINGILAARARRQSDIEQEIGPYRIERPIGEGGLAVVYLAHHALLKRPTAIKQLKRANLSAQNLMRFEREVQLACKLKHPNSIEIYDYGRTPQGNFYCAMEYIDGITLQTLLDLYGPLPPERVAYLLIEICRSLREAHAAGMIHRDIKPQNIMLSKRASEFDCVKVLDFGLAREIEAPASRSTDTRMLVGTPMYIAPERIIDPTCIDPRSDIFSLGVLGFVLLTGTEPLKSVNALGILSQIVSSEPKRPSLVMGQTIPPALDSLIWQCQARRPDDRLASVQQLLDRLQQIEFDPQWDQVRARQWWELHALTYHSKPCS